MKITKHSTYPIRQLGTFKTENLGFRTRVVCQNESFNLFGDSAADSQKQANRLEDILEEHAALSKLAAAAREMGHFKNALAYRKYNKLPLIDFDKKVEEVETKYGIALVNLDYAREQIEQRNIFK